MAYHGIPGTVHGSQQLKEHKKYLKIVERVVGKAVYKGRFVVWAGDIKHGHTSTGRMSSDLIRNGAGKEASGQCGSLQFVLGIHRAMRSQIL